MAAAPAEALRLIEDILPRRLAIAFFRLWGAAHPLAKEYRWRFDMALY